MTDLCCFIHNIHAAPCLHEKSVGYLERLRNSKSVHISITLLTVLIELLGFEQSQSVLGYQIHPSAFSLIVLDSKGSLYNEHYLNLHIR